jgi:single-strand DNA-binding protein
MTQQSIITINGFVGADPVSFGREGGSAACSFRIGCTPRYFNASTGQWCDRATTWLTVKAFRTLALNVLRSLHKGDPVVATGALVAEEWNKDGVRHVKMVMEATSVGHDLSLGVSDFTRTKASGETFERYPVGRTRGDDPYVDRHIVASTALDTIGKTRANDEMNMGAELGSAGDEVSEVDQTQADEFGAQLD